MPFKVLIVDDSALIRSLLASIIRQSSELELVGAAADPFIAREMILQFKPDVITLDIEMPRMDGLTFLEKLMAARPTPVIMISTLTHSHAEATLRALELGAVDFIEKPSVGIAAGLNEYAEIIIEKLLAAAKASLHNPSRSPASPVAYKTPLVGAEKIIAIGASTGGTEAIKSVLSQLPSNIPGIVITQHMPAGFTESFARRLDRLTRLTVVEAKGEERILPGHVFLAPGDKHLIVARMSNTYITRLNDEPPSLRHKPAVDLLFNSVAAAAGRNAVAVLLTGMGKDGARGMLNIHQQGGHTIAQDEKSCVVFGMPREAIKLGGVNEVIPLNGVGEAIVRNLSR
ncbi:protein-glutamate methylesterase/protein-glutamine glutaminase [Cellvibrio polysaccharolyticus]|uniref:Protein-glutamate methylesterase/protein-glutamine glutaminase n=1 Tax=Cellvibrio polysaccharolyticus TaxID=2082724 RepID=A0A928YUV4_9GAMM|nr:chemotaxis response regulator protein-glutamate methylesterase [Cellvibrio polysaccharolyticus]MBE8718364.1 chemotaxis response regulator protein-glutamate methylesterase [Cellvibrio polysaccharolyticus]